VKTKIADSYAVYRLTVTRHLWVRNVLFLCGTAAALTWMGTDILASLRYDGYTYPFDPISGLSAIDAPTRSFVTPLLGIYVVFKAAFSLGVWNSAGQKRALRITAGLVFASVLTDLAGSFFPWNPAESLGTFQNIMHTLLTGAITVLLIFLTLGFGANAAGRSFRLYSYGTLLLMLILGALPLLGGIQITVDQPPAWFGAGERVNAYGYMLWMVVLAIVLLRSQQATLLTQEGEMHADRVVPPTTD
jgi:hypothetical protein